MTNADARENRGYGFPLGLIVGSVLGGLAVFYAPRVTSALRKQVTDSARSLRNAASDTYQDARTRVEQAVDDLGKKGRGLRDDVCDAVAEGAKQVERYANETKRN